MNISLRRPLPDGIGVVSQQFGEHPDWYAKFGVAGHNGIDYACPEGTPITAAHAGRIEVGNDPAGYGLFVRVVGDKVTTLYGHLSEIEAYTEAGDETIIGWSGNTGNSTGPHLHFGFKIHGLRNPAYRDWIDPVPFRDI